MSDPANEISHKSFHIKGTLTITIPQHDPIKQAYSAEIKAIIESEENDNENT